MRNTEPSNNIESFQKISNDQRANHVGHLFFWIIFMYFTIQKLGGTFLDVCFSLFLFISIIKLAQVFLKNNKRLFLKVFAYKFAFWMSGFGIAFAAHQYYKHTINQTITQVLASIDSYQQKNKHYPPSNYFDAQFLKKHRIYYQLKSGKKPTLMYYDTYRFFASYHYDFDKKTWQYWVD